MLSIRHGFEGFAASALNLEFGFQFGFNLEIRGHS